MMLSMPSPIEKAKTPQQIVDNLVAPLGLVCLGVRGEELVFALDPNSSHSHQESKSDLAKRIIRLLLNNQEISSSLSEIKSIAIAEDNYLA